MHLPGLISSAYAQTASQPAADPMSQLLQGPLPLLAIMGLIFYFLVFRPQQQRAKQHKQELAGLKRGDSIVTAGGIIGSVARVVSDDELLVDIADNVRVRVVRSTITGVTGRGEPRTDAKPETTEKTVANQPARPARRGRPSAVEGKAQD